MNYPAASCEVSKIVSCSPPKSPKGLIRIIALFVERPAGGLD